MIIFPPYALINLAICWDFDGHYYFIGPSDVLFAFWHGSCACSSPTGSRLNGLRSTPVLTFVIQFFIRANAFYWSYAEVDDILVGILPQKHDIFRVSRFFLPYFINELNGYSSIVEILRDHLFIWTVFAPKVWSVVSSNNYAALYAQYKNIGGYLI
jgi:hypothetical protein